MAHTHEAEQDTTQADCPAHERGGVLVDISAECGYKVN
jgi:hypothetical protein